MPSLLEALEARRAEVLGQAERLCERIAGLSEEVSRAEERLARLQIARETVEEVPAAPSSPVPDADAAGGGAGGVASAGLFAAACVEPAALEAAVMTHARLEDLLGARMREVTRQLFQDHLTLRARDEARRANAQGDGRGPPRSS